MVSARGWRGEGRATRARAVDVSHIAAKSEGDVKCILQSSGSAIGTCSFADIGERMLQRSVCFSNFGPLNALERTSREVITLHDIFL